MPRAALLRLALPALLAVLPALIGCSGDSAFRVETLGPAVPMGAPLGVDVENQFGSVQVIAEPWVTTPQVDARLRSPNWVGGTQPARRGEAAWVSAETVEQDGRFVLRVLADTPPDAAERVHVDLVVRVPSCDGVSVRSAGGPIRIMGVGGAIDARNGRAGRAGGLIEVRTDRPLIDPVHLETTEGDILYMVGPEASGVFDARTESGAVQVSQRVGTLASIRPTATTWSAVYNGGTNPVTLLTGRGDIEIRFIEDARTFSSIRRNVR